MSVVLGAALSRIIARNLNDAGRNLGTSLQRLTSGKRVNSSSDGIIDLNHIDQINYQTASLYRSILGVNEFTGIANQADQGLSNMLDISYRLRELALQATNSNLTSAERDALSAEAENLLEELSNYASETEYGGTKLLNGGYKNISVHNGYTKNHSFQFSIGDARTTVLGRLAIQSGAQGGLTSGAFSSGNSLRLNNVLINAPSDDGFSAAGANYSAIAIANAINAQSGESNVFAEALATSRTLAVGFGGSAPLWSGTIASGEFQINGVNVTGSPTSASELATLINGYSADTGVNASLDGSGNIVLTASDGRNIDIMISTGGLTNNAWDLFNLSTNQDSGIFSAYTSLSSAGSDRVYTGAVRLWSADGIQISGTGASLAVGFAAGQYNTSASTAVSHINLSSEDGAAQAVKVLDATIAQISTLRAEVGAVHSRLEFSSQYLVDRITTLEDTKYGIEAVDYARETVNLVMAQILQDTNAAILAHANLSPVSVARLLQGS